MLRGDTDQGEELLLDRYLPTYDATQRRHAVVDADAETTYEAILTADLMRSGRLVAALGGLRVLPARIGARLRGVEKPPAPESMTFADVAETDWVRLAERPGEELVLGAVGALWKPVIEWREIDPDEFERFEEPGYAKLAIGLSVRSYGEDRSLLTYEARTRATDPDSRRRFLRYWRLIGPFAGYVMGKGLDRIGADAEAEARADRTGGSRLPFLP